MSDRTSKRRRKGEPDLPSDEDDQAVWSHVARQVKRPIKMKRRVPAVEAALAPAPKPSVAREREARISDATASRSLVPTVMARAPDQAPPPLATFDPKQARRIGSGRREIDARIDLHGMRQEEAHAALVSFLITAQARGHRIVLVITGKGGGSQRASGDAELFGRERGVLKRNVPRWLEEPELRRIVVSYTTASLRHGGEGALYIHLRARRQ